MTDAVERGETRGEQPRHQEEGEGEEEEEEILEPVLPSVMCFIQLMLTGPDWCGTRFRAPLWASSVTVLAFCAGLMLKTFNTALTDSSTLWSGLGYFFTVVLIIAGCLMANTVYIMAQVVQQAASGPGAGTAELLNPHQGPHVGQFVQTLLLHARITPRAAAKIEKKRKLAIAAAGMPAVVFLAVMTAFFYLFMTEGDTPNGGAAAARNASDPRSAGEEEISPFSGWSIAQELMLFCVGVCALFPSAAAYCGLRLFMEIPIIVSVDLIEQSTKRLLALESAPRDICQYDDAMASIQRAHELTVRLSALLGPPLLANIGVWMCFGILWATAAVAPRTTLPPDSMLNTLFPPWGLLAATNFALLMGIWPLIEAGEASSACTQLLAATAVLRWELQEEGSTAVADSAAAAGGGSGSGQGLLLLGGGQAGGGLGSGGVSPLQGDGGGGGTRRRMVSPEHLIRLKGLQRYAAELNRSQGFGFTLRKHRITEQAMVRMVFKCVSLNLSVLCWVAAWDAYTADPYQTVSQRVPLPVWTIYLLWPAAGAKNAIFCAIHI